MIYPRKEPEEDELTDEELREELREAIREGEMLKKGIIKGEPAFEFLNGL